jgi:hypothetical protein
MTGQFFVFPVLVNFLAEGKYYVEDAKKTANKNSKEAVEKFHFVDLAQGPATALFIWLKCIIMNFHFGNDFKLIKLLTYSSYYEFNCF